MDWTRHDIERQGTGFSLVEVLVAMAVFSIGLAGLSLTLMSAVEGSATARNHSAAVMHASALAELILMNPASLGHYIDPATPSADCITDPPCTEAHWAAGNLARWQFDLRQSLVHAQGLVCRDSTPSDGSVEVPACDGAGQAVVKVLWRADEPAGMDSYAPQRVVLTVPE